MNGPSVIDSAFRRHHESIVSAYERQLEEYKTESERQLSWRRRREQRTFETLRAAGLDLDALSSFDRESEEELQEFLSSIRPDLLGRAPSRSVQASKRILHGTPLQRRVTTPVYGATLLAPHRANLERNEGESGNPWVLPNDPTELRIEDSSTGSGWGCWAEASPPPPEADMWYTFTPDQTGQWFLWVFTDLHGFYILRADDSWYNCKSASVEIVAGMDVEQYDTWHGPLEASQLKLSDDNISTYQLFDRTPWLQYVTPLRAGDPVWVRAWITVDAFAAGGGSYAEANFAAGSGNYIQPLALIAGLF
jgi:hypothetical protein